VDILRKIGDWAWVNKERLVLAVLVLFLAYRIYTVLNPSTLEEQTAQAAPAAGSQVQDGAEEGPEWPDGDQAQGLRQRLRNRQGQQGEDGEGAAEATDPAEQPLVFTQHMPPRRIPDPNDLPEEWEESEGRPPMPPANPLPPAPVAYKALVNDNPFTATDIGKDDEDFGEVALLDIKPWGPDSYRALIQTRTQKWYEEGESFEAYTLISIDPEAGTVEVFSESTGTTRTYTIGR
jgi:hypothetical protein